MGRLIPLAIGGSLGIYLGYGFLVAGLMTNEFRYPPSLEDTIVLRHVVTLGLAVIGVHLAVLFLRKRSLVAKIMPPTATLIAMGIITFLMVEVHGCPFPPTQTAHLDRNGVQTVTLEGEDLSYSLELENPFSISHREYLVLERGTQEIRIVVPLFPEPRGGYVQAIQGADWCTLEKTADLNIFHLHTTPHLRKAIFEIDLAGRSAREIDFIKP